VSGAGGPRSARAAARPAAGSVALPGLGLQRVLDALRSLPDARWLDRLLRGQGWIILIGGALMGIVAMQVTLLEMNSGIGRSIERAGTLERQNAELRAEVSKLSMEERIASVAGAHGLVMPNAGDVRYVTVRGERDARKAAAVMRAPNPVADLAAGGAAATATATVDPATGATAATPADPATGAATTTAPPTATATAPQATPDGTTPAAGTAGATAAPTTATPTPAPGQ
jgi:cell division protein FtsL